MRERETIFTFEAEHHYQIVLPATVATSVDFDNETKDRAGLGRMKSNHEAIAEINEFDM